MPRLLEIMFCIIVIIIESFNPIIEGGLLYCLFHFTSFSVGLFLVYFFNWTVLICCGIKSNTCFVNANHSHVHTATGVLS